MPRILEASRMDREAYRQSLREITDNLDNLNANADRAVVDLFSGLRRQTADILSDLGDSPSGPLYQRTLDGIDSAINDFAERWGIRLDVLQQEGFAVGEELAARPLEQATAAFDGSETIQIARLGPTTDQLRILAQFRADLIQGATDELRKRVRNEVAAVAVGARSFTDAASAIGRNLTDRNHFSTVMHRARAITVTELGRAQSLATQATQERAAEDVTNLRKRWLNAHLPGARATHLAAEARYAEGGPVGPIPVNEPYAVGGFDAMYPHDPSLPARESVHCHCVSISVLIDPSVTPEEEDPAPTEEEPLTDQDAERLADEEPELTPIQRENIERFERLAQPLERPKGWSKMTKKDKLAWLENAMEEDFPLGEEWRDSARVPRTETTTLPSGRKRRRVVYDTVPKVKGTPLQTAFDLTDMDPEAAFGSMNELRRLSRSFPEVAERLAYVGTYRGAKGAEWKIRKKNQFGGEYAHASVDGRRLALSPSPKFFGNLDNLEGHVSWDYGTDFHPVGGAESVLIHEFGHHVENWLSRNSSKSLIPTGVRADTFGTISTIKNQLTQTFALGGPDGPGGYLDMGRYALKSTHEGWAETFAAYWYRKHDIEWEWRVHDRGGRATGEVIQMRGARPSYGEAYDRGAGKGEAWLDRFGRFMDTLSTTRLEEMPSINDLTDFRSLSDADKALHMDLRRKLIEDLGGPLPSGAWQTFEDV